MHPFPHTISNVVTSSPGKNHRCKGGGSNDLAHFNFLSR
jgi:hypothetical protein